MKKGQAGEKIPDITPALIGEVEETKELQCSSVINILVLDDDKAICKVIKAALGANNYNVEAISSANQIEAALKSSIYHVVILDYKIPGVDPQRIFEWLRLHQKDASIIVITAFPSVDSARDCLRARTFDYLTKPFQIPELQQTVNRCLETRGLLRPSEEALRESLGNAIRDRRKELGQTLAQMAQRTGLSLGYLSQIELGKNSASIETLYRISLGMGISMSNLFEIVQKDL